MYFKEWCFNTYGILNFSEGKIVNCVSFSAKSNASIQLEKLCKDYGGYSQEEGGTERLIFTRYSYEKFLDKLKEALVTRLQNKYSIEAFNLFKKGYFERMNVDIESEQEFRQLPNIHISFTDWETQIKFATNFSEYRLRPSSSPLLSTLSIEAPYALLTELYQLYYQNNKAEIHHSDVKKLQYQKVQIQQIIEDTLKHKLQRRLDLAQLLSQDRSNKSMQHYEACSAYALSLRVYMVLNYDNLSPNEHQSLSAATNMLAAYNGIHLGQSLKTDANFVTYITKLYLGYLNKAKPQEKPLIQNLPPEVGGKILDLIEANAETLLEGADSVPLGKKSFFKMLRFLPDQSETDVIHLLTGGRATHATVTRIIKVGISAETRQPCRGDEKPHHFEYFKIEHNAGAGCRNPDNVKRTCDTTHITQILPFAPLFNEDFFNATYVHFIVDPFQNPTDYQKAMKFTLKTLIKIERLLMFYRAPSLGPNGEARCNEHSSEAREWVRLTFLKNILSGAVHNEELTYYATDTIDPSRRYAIKAQNKRGYLQESGSCLIASPKAFLSSMLGEIISLHSLFMQQHNAQGYFVALLERLQIIDYRITQLKSIEDKATQSIISNSPDGFFKMPTRSPGLQMLTSLPLPSLASITSAIIADDKYKSGKLVLKIKCASESELDKVCDVLGSITRTLPPITRHEGYAIIGESRLRAICSKQKFNFKLLWGGFPIEVPKMNLASNSL
jgi:hypothetical protein